MKQREWGEARDVCSVTTIFSVVLDVVLNKDSGL